MFTDRHEAGKRLAEKLDSFRGSDAVVLALPRGGVVLGYEVAKALQLPLDIIAVRKIGHPFSPEYAIGAVDENGTTILNEAETATIDRTWLKTEIEAQKAEAKRRSTAYRSGRNPLPITGKIVVIVDDGIATGMTMRVAVRYAVSQKAKVVVAVPVAASESLRALTQEGASYIVVLESPEEFAGAVGAHYMAFEQVEDDEVIRLLQEANTLGREIRVKIGTVELEGIFALPVRARGFVIFAHGSGSSRFSPRNAYVAQELQKAGIGTLLIDLLTPQEDEVYETRFNIELLTERLASVVEWVRRQKEMEQLLIGLFGASTGAAAALRVAAHLGELVAAVVSRGGRPDLAMDELPEVVSPTLLIVGADDTEVIELNKQALAALSSVKKLEIVSGATHLFEEEGALEKVASIASQWFVQYLAPPEIPEDVVIQSKFANSAEQPTRPPGKTRSGAKEGYRHFRHKK